MRRIAFACGMILVALAVMAETYECDNRNDACIYLDLGRGRDFECAGGNGGGGGGGGGGGPTHTAVPTATATTVPTATPAPPSVWETLGGNYANDTPCSGGTGDPIGTVFTLAGADAGAASDLANNRLSDIGMTTGYGNPVPGGPELTSRDNFLDNGGCVEGDITRATNGGWHPGTCPFPGYCIDSRWHVRCIVHAQPSAYGYWASCTPHWDSGPPPDCPEHYVPAVYNGTENYGGSGYDAVRDWTWWQLVHELGMTDAGPVFFDNTDLRSQCDGTIFSQADSKVNVIVLQ